MRLPAAQRDSTVVIAALVVGVVALLGGCPSKKTKYPLCGGDNDCKEGERCINKHCQACGDDSHCKPYEHCEKGACVLDPGACRESSDCPDGGVCKDNKCTPCEDDGECGADQRCQDGKCLKRGACKADEDCADDEDCVEGTCKRGDRDASAAPCPLEPVFFDFDTTQVSETAKAALGKDAECIGKAKDRGVLLVGHTDPRGTEEYNIALSEHRAQTVGDYLARLGIDPARFRFVPKGETEATGSDEAGWSQDRRVELEWQ